MITFHSAGGELSPGRLVYRRDEYSFDFAPRSLGSRSIGIGTLQIGIDEDQRLVSVWGMCPYSTWREGRLTIPRLSSGAVVADGLADLPLGHTVPVDSGSRWPIVRDPNSGWICVGDHEVTKYDQFIEFASGCAVGLSGGELVGLWLHPDDENT